MYNRSRFPAFSRFFPRAFISSTAPSVNLTLGWFVVVTLIFHRKLNLCGSSVK